MSTTVSITQSLKNAALKTAVRVLLGVCLCLFLVYPQRQARATEVTQLQVERGDEGVRLSALVRFDLPPVVEDALLKGIPMFFVLEADIYRDRWYWADLHVASAARTIRLAYQPLTRRWRVNIAAGLISNSAGLRATLNQNYDTLPEALAVIQRVARWKIAEASEVNPDAGHRLDFSFRLDLSQLPRPFQIGVAGQRDWTIAVQVKDRLRLEPAAAAAPALPAASSTEAGK